MAFFEDLTKKVSETAQSVVQKGKDLAGLASINASVADEEKKIKALYELIGKMLVEQNGDDLGEPFAPLVSEIRAREDKISEYKKQINELKGTVTCTGCGAEAQANAAFCTACGRRLEKEAPAEEAEARSICPECKNEVSPEATFCTICGYKPK